MVLGCMLYANLARNRDRLTLLTKQRMFGQYDNSVRREKTTNEAVY